MQLNHDQMECGGDMEATHETQVRTRGMTDDGGGRGCGCGEEGGVSEEKQENAVERASSSSSTHTHPRRVKGSGKELLGNRSVGYASASTVRSICRTSSPTLYLVTVA